MSDRPKVSYLYRYRCPCGHEWEGTMSPREWKKITGRGVKHCNETKNKEPAGAAKLIAARPVTKNGPHPGG